MALFLICQQYGDLSAVERLRAEHAAWIERHADSETFLLAGQTEPVGGSVILVQGDSREHVERLLQQDAFLLNGVVTSTEIVEFRPHRGSLRKFAANPLFVKAKVPA